MPQSTSLLATIVIGLVLAFGCGFVASRLHLPLLVGYLLAGIAVGPASQLAEIGVVLLMFGIGLRFSIRDLLTVYPIALPGALAQIATCLVICVTLAVLWVGAGAPASCSASVYPWQALLCCSGFWKSGALSTTRGPHRDRLAHRSGPRDGAGAGGAPDPRQFV